MLDMYNQHLLCYIFCIFCLKSLILLEVMYEKKRGCFFVNTRAFPCTTHCCDARSNERNIALISVSRFVWWSWISAVLDSRWKAGDWCRRLRCLPRAMTTKQTTPFINRQCVFLRRLAISKPDIRDKYVVLFVSDCRLVLSVNWNYLVLLGRDR